MGRFDGGIVAQSVTTTGTVPPAPRSTPNRRTSGGVVRSPRKVRARKTVKVEKRAAATNRTRSTKRRQGSDLSKAHRSELRRRWYGG